MTDAELRRALAEALGYEVRWFEGEWSSAFGGQYRSVNRWCAVVAPNFEEATKAMWALDEEGAWLAVSVSPASPLPDWPADLGAAMALCLEIARKHDWDLEMYVSPLCDPLLYYAYFCDLDESQLGEYKAATPARALAELALAALKGGG